MKSILAAAAVLAATAWADDPNTAADPNPAADQNTAVKKEECEPKAEAPKPTPEQIRAAREKSVNSIRELTDQLATAFNDRDAKAAAATFAEDAVLISPKGERAVGRDAIEKQFQSNLDGFLKDSRTTLTNVDIRLLKPNVAFVDMEHVVSCEHAPDKALPRIHVSAVAVRREGKWLFEEARPATYLPEKPVS
jgi:uncharacterized protein (TIGR02246 family)